QLNYRNFRYLTKNELHWITLPIPAEADGLRVYAELMTKFDNPKFPDQLGSLGGDKRDYRIPWEQAAADPHSHFGVTQVVLHDQPAPLQSTLAHLRALIARQAPESFADVASDFTAPLETAIRAFREDRATDDDTRWINGFLQSGFLSNDAKLTPRLAALI